MEFILILFLGVAVLVAFSRISDLRRRLAQLESGAVSPARPSAARAEAGAAKEQTVRRGWGPGFPAPPEPEPVEAPGTISPSAARTLDPADSRVMMASELEAARAEVRREQKTAESSDVSGTVDVPERVETPEPADGLGTPDDPSPPTPPPPPATREFDWEKTIGVRLPVWGGAIMLLIAGFFLISWAIETGIGRIFTPEVRTALCGLAAAGLLATAFVVKARGIANGDRIAAALAAAAVALAYGTMFLAAMVFQLVPGPVALIAAAILTAAVVAVATQFDQRVMLVGLLGGYLSPFFVWWSPSSYTELIAGYVIVLLTVSTFAIRWNGWWGQAIPAMVAPALWALALMTSGSPLTLAIFYLLLAAIPAAVALLPLRADAEKLASRHQLVLYGALIAALLLTAGAAYHLFDMALVTAIIALSAGAGLLVRLDANGLRWPWLATLAASVVLLVSWTGADQGTLLVATLLLAAIHLGALAMQFRSGAAPARRSFEIAGLTAFFFIVLLVKLDGWLGARDVPYAWAALALLLSAAFAFLAIRRDEGARAGFAIGTSAFLSLSLGLALDPGLYAPVAALQACGLALLYSRFRQPILQSMHVAYACLYLFLLGCGEVMASANDLFGGIDDALEGMGDFIPAIHLGDAPITLLLLPGLLAFVASTAFKRVAHSRLVVALDVAAVVLLAAGLHFVILPTIPYDIVTRAFTTGWLWFNAMGALAVAAIYAGGRLGRKTLSHAGTALAAGSAAVMLFWAILPIFRFWPQIDTPGLPVFNLALLALGLPALLMLGAAYLVRGQGNLNAARGLAAFGGFAGLITILVLIRQAVHGPSLQGPGAVPGQVELYLYSGGMLLYGFAILAAGVRFNSVALRGGSLLVVLATIGKVFLYDVSGLEGLWRVGSFLGMGIALLAVSWFYGRYVFGIGPSGTKRASPTGTGGTA